ncbi:MAG: hypothetical protein WED04_00840 [Promethearchaeati archaeon SRVP18_Atabeyarchaeia-1]
MPKGLIILHWDDATGPVVGEHFPDERFYNEGNLITAFSSAAMAGTTGFQTLRIGNSNIASFYTGMAVRGRPQYMVAIVLRQDESGEKYKESLEKISGRLIARRNQENFQQLLSDSFRWMSLRVRVNTGELKITGSVKKELETMEKELLAPTGKDLGATAK